MSIIEEKYVSLLYQTIWPSPLNSLCPGLFSNAIDHKQPMLCESIRQFRRELALVLLRHYRTHNEKIEEVLGVLLEKERYSFMSRNLQHVGDQSSTFSTQQQQNSSNNNNSNSTTRDRKNKGKKILGLPDDGYVPPEFWWSGN